MTPMRHDTAADHVIATDPRFAVEGTTIRGVSYRVFRNVPPTLPNLLRASATAEVAQLATALQNEHGVGKGDRVALAMRNCPELPILFMAITSLGAVAVFLNAQWTAQELAYALADSSARLVFADGERLRRLQAGQSEIKVTVIGVRDGETPAQPGYSALRAAGMSGEPADVAIHTDDDMAIMYSSGSTGHPKGVVLTHRGAINAVFTWLMQAVMQQEGIGMSGVEYLARPGAVGRLYPPLQDLRFLDDDGRDVPPGELGEITVKDPCNMRCYLNQPDATAEVLRDGWLRPGSGHDQASIAAFLSQYIARFKIREHLWVQHTPLCRGATDKIDRRALRADCLATLDDDTTKETT